MSRQRAIRSTNEGSLRDECWQTAPQSPEAASPREPATSPGGPGREISARVIGRHGAGIGLTTGHPGSSMSLDLIRGQAGIHQGQDSPGGPGDFPARPECQACMTLASYTRARDCMVYQWCKRQNGLQGFPCNPLIIKRHIGKSKIRVPGRHPGRLTGGAPRRAPAADGDAVAVEDQRTVGVAPRPPPREGFGNGV